MSDFIIENGVLTKYTGNGGNVVIPQGVRAIGDGAFIGSRNVSAVTIPDTVQTIGEKAFFQRKILQSITIPDSVTSIGKSAFKECGSLQSVILGKSITEIPSALFAGCNKLLHIKIMGNVTKIGAEAFKYCGMKSISLPDTVKHIESLAFGECYRMQKLTLPRNIEQIDSGAIPFYIQVEIPSDFSQSEAQTQMLLERFGISRLPISFLFPLADIYPDIRKKIIAKAYRNKYFPKLIDDGNADDFKKLLSIIPKMSAEEIDSYLEKSVDKHTAEITNALILYKNRLYSTEKLLEIQNIEAEKALGLREKTISDYRKEFKISQTENGYVIKGCKSQSDTVFIPGEIKGLPVTVERHAFYYLSHIRTVYIEEGVTEIGPSAFEKCYHLENIEIPQSVTAIGGSAFYECFYLQNIKIPASVSKISPWTFHKCIALKTLTLESGVTEIDWCAFHECRNLQSITIPASVTSIHDSAFYECKNLTIYAPEGSYAQAFAKRRNIKFQAI